MKKSIRIDPKTIHDQLLHRKKEYPFIPIGESLTDAGIKYTSYRMATSRGVFSYNMLKSLSDIDIILPDEVLLQIYPKYNT